MKYSKKYLAFTIILAVVFLLKFQVFGRDMGEIADFRGGALDSEVWNPLVASDVNDSPLTVVIDNKEYSSLDIHFYMNSDCNIMAPVSILRDALNCSSHVYEGTRLLVEKRSLVADFTLGELTAYNGQEDVAIGSALSEIADELYVSLNDLADLLGYSCSFDYTSNTLTMADTSEQTTVIPSKYDLREKDRVSTIRNQGTYGTCWAFAAISAMESALLPEQVQLYSVDHMTMCNSFNVNQYDGGEYTMGMAYLAAWQGPVYEEDDPYGDDETDETLTAVAHVQEMRIIDGKDYVAIKTAVFKYGGVQTSLYSTLSSSAGDTEYYNSETSAYCYIGTEKPNHDVVIIGWDDNYPKENFAMELEGDGAFICQNSWGTEFGEDGVFYVSYYDTNIGTHNVVYTGIESIDNYDHIYQSDLCGWVGSLGYDKEDVYGADVFTAEGDEEVAAASFYATGSNTEYTLYIVTEFEDEGSFARRQEVASGTLDQAGYYTIDFDEAVTVSAGEKYAVVLYIKTEGSSHPLAIEYDTGDSSLITVDLDDGEGYISYNGNSFINVKEKQDCNLCIKAFTNDM